MVRLRMARQIRTVQSVHVDFIHTNRGLLAEHSNV
jgi:hypothetical protein